jgi:UDP-glucuronate 4-epimerase
MADHILVTGCAGFIASRTAQLLLEDGHHVVGVDNLNDAYDVRLKHWRLEQLQQHDGFQFHAIDVADRVALDGLVETASASNSASKPPFDGVVHLAARAGVRTSVENPWIYYEANCVGTLNLLDLCRRFGVPKLVLASTSSLYGEGNPVPYHEDADTNHPVSPYAASKKAAETLAYSYHYLHGLDISVVRYFTVYGPAGRPDMSVFRFVRRIAEGESIVVFGDGTQSRDFTFVDDIARGTIAALRPLGYEVINLGGDRPHELADMIQQIGGLVEREVKIEYQPAHPADVSTTWANITKAQRLLDWSPQVDLEEGLRRCVAWYYEHRDLALSLVLGDRPSMK